jgi:hypothetical protein
MGRPGVPSDLEIAGGLQDQLHSNQPEPLRSPGACVLADSRMSFTPLCLLISGIGVVRLPRGALSDVYDSAQGLTFRFRLMRQAVPLDGLTRFRLILGTRP